MSCRIDAKNFAACMTFSSVCEFEFSRTLVSPRRLGEGVDRAVRKDQRAIQPATRLLGAGLDAAPRCPTLNVLAR